MKTKSFLALVSVAAVAGVILAVVDGKGPDPDATKRPFPPASAVDRGSPDEDVSREGVPGASAPDRPSPVILHLPAVADVWISHATPQESESSAGGSPVFKLKSVEEMAALRFDVHAARGHRIRRARLHLRLRHPPAPHWLRVSTVSSTWVEGEATRAYSGRDGACWRWADASSRRPWAWEGSAFCDVIMGEGFSRNTVVQVRGEENDWIAVDIPPSMIQAILCERSDGLALMEGGSPANRNYYFHSRQAWSNHPWLELELQEAADTEPPEPPVFTVEPAPERASLAGGAAVVRIVRDPRCFAWRLRLDGEPLPAWRVPSPTAGRDTTVFHLEGLAPGRHHLGIEAFSATGQISAASEASFLASAALDTLPPLPSPSPFHPQAQHRKPPRLWALPALAQLDPLTTGRLDLAENGAVNPWDANAIWDGRMVHLVGGRGETVSFQLIVQSQGRHGNLADRVPASLRIVGDELSSAARDTLRRSHWSFYRVWYFHRGNGPWQPSYLLPLDGDEVPWRGEEPELGSPDNRAFLVELALDRHLPPGLYRGEVVVELHPGGRHLLPVQVEVTGFTLPRAPTFRIELNAYHLRREALQHFRLARANRCVFTPWVAAPSVVEGEAKSADDDSTAFTLDWTAYDALLGPLLDGSAFARDRRPLEVLYLPLREGWPTRLTPANYAYRGPWPQKGDPFRLMWAHHETAPPLEEALAPSYLARLGWAEEDFLDHFETKGWRGTELHFFLNSKMRDRVLYGHSTWWNTDEPLYWPDWAALRFYLEFFDRRLPRGKKRQWLTRADISRPEWLRGALGTAARIVYTGGELDEAQARRCRALQRDLHLRWEVYSAAANENAPPAETAAWVLGAWMDQARGALVWQSLAPADAWVDYDPPDAPGTALLATWPDPRLPAGTSPAGSTLVAVDLRVKALRDAQQSIEWLEIWKQRNELSGEQIRHLLRPFFSTPPQRWWHGSESNPHRVRFGTLDAKSLESLRRAVIALLRESAPVDSTP